MPERIAELLIADMLESIQRIRRYTLNMSYTDFVSDDKTLDAVYRNFEIIGEASNRLPENFVLHHPEIDWIKLSGLRNRIIHAYFGVDNEILWKIIKENIDELETKLIAIKQH